MDVIDTDIAIVGAGGAGLRAAIAVAEAEPSMRVALISKVYPMRSHTCAAEGGAAGVARDNDSLENHFNDTVSGGDWLTDQDAVEEFVEAAPRELTRIEHWGCPWSRTEEGRVAVRPFGGMKIERTWYAADKTGFHLLHTLFQTSLKYPSIERYDEFYATDLMMVDGVCRGVTAVGDPHRQADLVPGAGGGDLQRRGRARVPVHDQRRDQDRRRHGHGLPGGRAAEGYGVRPVSPDRAAGHGDSDDRRAVGVKVAS